MNTVVKQFAGICRLWIDILWFVVYFTTLSVDKWWHRQLITIIDQLVDSRI
jgi:hypothetical protein